MLNLPVSISKIIPTVCSSEQVLFGLFRVYQERLQCSIFMVLLIVDTSRIILELFDLDSVAIRFVMI